MSFNEHMSESGGERPVSLRARKDLSIEESQYQGETCWIIKDPLAMKYFRLKSPEYRVFQLLNDQHSYRQIQRKIQLQFPEYKVEIANVQQLVGTLHKNGLLIAHTAGQAEPLKKRNHSEKRKKLVQLLSSIVAIRFPGVDPERFLNTLYPFVRWFFTATCTVINLLIIAAAVLLIVTNFDECMRRLPEFQQFFGFNNLMFMFAVLIVTKSIHELGHGMMCKHFGGECHEIGFMLLVMTPAMYCNTSDSWTMANKWKRIAIGAAGMYVEVVLAAICTFVWWTTQPGFLHYVCLNVMFLSGVSTIVFNANPLLRYDGYFMLSDYLEIPNLSSKSKLSLINQLRVWCLGMKPVSNRMLPERNQLVFAMYSVASFVYRWFVLFFIFWFLHEVFEPYGLQVIGHTAIALSLVGMVVLPLVKLIRFFSYPGRFRDVKRVPTMITLSVVSVLLVTFFFVELPHSVWVHFAVRPANAQYVYVNQPGRLSQIHVAPGDAVVTGQLIAELENPELLKELAKLEGDLASYEADYLSYQMLDRKRLVLDASRKASEAQTSILATKKLIRTKRKQIEELKLRATRDGVILPPPNLPRPETSELELEKWSGTPFDIENRAAYLERETLFCVVGDEEEMKALLVVEQSDVKLLQPDQRVQLVVHQYRDQRLSSKLAAVSQDELNLLPRELSKTNGGPVAGMPLPNGQEKPLLKSYEATANLDNVDVKLLPGMFGTARVEVGTATLARRLWRQIQTVINFR